MNVSSEEERENVHKITFTSLFELDNGRYQDREYIERFSRDNLQKIEQRQQEQLKVFAERMGGEYVPPSVDEVEGKFDQTLRVNPFVFPSVGSGGRIWALHEDSVYSNMKNCAAFNNSGEHGVIVFSPDDGGSRDDEKKIRLYRGARIKLGQQQVAPLARMEGVSINDLESYRDGGIGLEDILEKVADADQRRYLAHVLEGITKAVARGNTTEMEELRSLHTCFTPGALDWDLWVAASYEPENTYRSGAESVGNVYGDFFNLQEGYLEGVMVLDVPESEVERYSGEAGIFAQIKPEWVRAIVPQHTASLEKNIRKAESLIQG